MNILISPPRYAVIVGLICLSCLGQLQAQSSNAPAPGECGFRLVEKTIQVPMMVTERRVVTVTECRTEIRERTVLVPKLIPETKQVRDVYTVMVPRTETRTERYQACEPVWREVVQNVTVQVPRQELRKETRRVCREVPVEEMRCVTRDDGVTEEVPVVVYRNKVVEEPHEYYATVYHPETRMQAVRVCDPVVREKQREFEVTVCAPQKQEALRNVSTFRTVTEPQVQRYCVKVPCTVQKEIEVQVCRLVTKKVVCRVPVTESADGQ